MRNLLRSATPEQVFLVALPAPVTPTEVTWCALDTPVCRHRRELWKWAFLLRPIRPE